MTFSSLLLVAGGGIEPSEARAYETQPETTHTRIRYGQFESHVL